MRSWGSVGLPHSRHMRNIQQRVGLCHRPNYCHLPIASVTGWRGALSLHQGRSRSVSRTSRASIRRRFRADDALDASSGKFADRATPATQVSAASLASVDEAGGGADEAEQQVYKAKVFNKMLKFLGPAVLIPLGDPLMALMDCVFVGQFAGTAELAAMGPANMLFSFALYIFRSLQVATLSLVACHLRDGQRSEAARYLGCGLTLALVLGCIGACVLSLGSHPLIAAMGVRDVALVGPAAGYLGIRALSLPAVLLTTVAQSGKLAQRDSMTPCLSVALTMAVSLVANVVFVGWLGWGLQGAAITTVATQYLGAAALLWALHHKSSQLKPDWRPARPDQLSAYLKTMAPLTGMFVSKNTCYLIAQAAAAGLATAGLAAHQAAFSLWTLFTWMMSPVEHAAMAYLPTATLRWQQQSTSHTVMTMGLVSAALSALTLGALLVLGPGLLVKDVAVQPLMSLIAPQAMISLMFVGVDMAATSINIALKDYKYVARSYVFTLAATAAYFGVCRSQAWGLPGVWWGLLMFFGLRCVQSVGRAVWLVDMWPGGRKREDPGTKVEVLAGAESEVGSHASEMSDGEEWEGRDGGSRRLQVAAA